MTYTYNGPPIYKGTHRGHITTDIAVQTGDVVTGSIINQFVQGQNQQGFFVGVGLEKEFVNSKYLTRVDSPVLKKAALIAAGLTLAIFLYATSK